MIDLLLGIPLRFENPAEHHYCGSIPRLGRALAESKERILFESKALAMLRDAELDDYNRVVIFFC